MSHPRVEEVSDSEPDSDPDEVDIDDFDDTDILRRRDDPRASSSGPSSSGAPFAAASAAAGQGAPLSGQPQTLPASADRSQYNNFQCLYPVYFDATRSRSEGRRVPANLAVKNPLAREIANACYRLRLPTLLNPDKVHPKDWSNPGRVKVGLKVAGTGDITNKHHLYILVAQHLKENPTDDDSIGLRVRIGGNLEPEQGKPYPRPAVPRGWKMGELLPYASAAMTGGGVSENLFKDMMKEMQGGGGPMSALMGGAGGAGAQDSGNGGSKKKKDKKKGKA